MHQPSIQAMTIFTNALCVCVCMCLYVYILPSLHSHGSCSRSGLYLDTAKASSWVFFVFISFPLSIHSSYSYQNSLPKHNSDQSLPHKLSSAPLCLQNKSYALLMAFKTQTTLFRFVQLHYASYATVRLDRSMILKHFISGSLCCLVAKWCQTLL